MKVRDYMIYKNDISSLKEEIGEKIGQKIIVKDHLGETNLLKRKLLLKKHTLTFLW